MGPRSALFLVISIVSLLGIFVYAPLTFIASEPYGHHPHFVTTKLPEYESPTITPVQADAPEVQAPLPGPVSSVPPLAPLTFIVLWSPQDREDNYLANFFQSIAANPSLDFLLVKIDKYGHNDGSCERQRAAHVPNVREVCISMDEYFALHVDYLCEHWACSDPQRKHVHELIRHRMPADRVNSVFRPFRAEIFRKYLHPELKLWGWCDLDMLLGNFDRIFPWDVAYDFDVIIAGWPVALERVLLFTPGHMTVFRRSAVIAAAFLQHPPLASYENYVSLPLPSDAPEEGEYSHLLLTQTGFTFLRFDAMIEAAHHVSSLAGVFSLENYYWADHSLGEGPPPVSVENAIVRTSAQIALAVRRLDGQAPEPTFSERGNETEVVLHDGAGAAEGLFIWFPIEYTVSYLSVLGPGLPGNGRDCRRYTMRRMRHGPVTERFEPVRRSIVDPPVPFPDWVYDTSNRPWLREGLYMHFQTEKYRPWWSLPDRPLADGEVLYIDKEHGAHLWDADGVMLWESNRTIDSET